MVFSSSLYAYGRTNKPKYKESEIPKPNTTYGISKLAGENLLFHFNKKFQFDFINLRYLFVYGPKQYSGTGYRSVIVKNFERILKKQSPTIYGDGEQTLDYVYIDDVIKATITSMEKPLSEKTINIGSSKPTSINKLINTMLKVSGKQLKPVYLPPDETHGTYRVGNIQKAKKLLNFTPTTSLQQGLKNTFTWMKSYYEN